MTDAERFHVALSHLRHLLAQLYGFELHVTLIGGQVLALELLSRGQSGELLVHTPTGLALSRGYTYEADLLFDIDSMSHLDDLPTRLRQAGFEPVRDFRWSKRVGDLSFLVDLFRAPSATEEPPCGMTPAAEGDFALNHRHRLDLPIDGGRLEVSVPDTAPYLAMKLAARSRRTSAKDAFDLYAYVRGLGARSIRNALARPELGPLRGELRTLFATPAAAGTRDVLSYANLAPSEAALLAQAVVDEFREIVDD